MLRWLRSPLVHRLFTRSVMYLVLGALVNLAIAWWKQEPPYPYVQRGPLEHLPSGWGLNTQPLVPIWLGVAGRMIFYALAARLLIGSPALLSSVRGWILDRRNHDADDVATAGADQGYPFWPDWVFTGLCFAAGLSFHLLLEESWPGRLLASVLWLGSVAFVRECSDRLNRQRMERYEASMQQHEAMGPYCPFCGYSMRGLEDRRCPECGRRPTHGLNIAPGSSEDPPAKPPDMPDA